MYVTYQLSSEELDKRFLDTIKSAFKGKRINITIEEYDETEYLLRSPKNRRKLLKSIENVKKSKNLITVPIDDIQKVADENDSI